MKHGKYGRGKNEEKPLQNEFFEKTKHVSGKVKKRILKTSALKFYLCKLFFRVGIFVSVFAMYLLRKDRMVQFMNQPFWNGISLVHVVWFVFMGIMFLHLIPNNWLSMAWKKARGTVYTPVNPEEVNELELLRFVQRMNRGAWKVMLVWLIFNAFWGFMYLFKLIGDADLLMLTVFYFLCDYICILFFCPFQTYLMKNKCCINCRIYDWGHFMMFTPMLFIRNFYSWSLFFMSLIVLIHWELQYARYPERFWEGTNKVLKCEHCREKTCQIKKRVSSGLHGSVNKYQRGET